MRENTRFVTVDPSHFRRQSDQLVTPLQCQICFKPFQTAIALRDHIARFQLELHQLAARTLEAQAHLSLGRSNCDEDFSSDRLCNEGSIDGNDTDSDDDIAGDNNSVDDIDDGDKDSPIGETAPCPRRDCGWTKAKEGLSRHYQSHVHCYEICVFCRSPFRQVHTFLRHRCSSRTNATDNAKEFYMAERCAQLRRYANRKLKQTVARNGSGNRQTRKRNRQVLGDTRLSIPGPKRARESLTQESNPAFLANRDVHGLAPSGHTTIFEHHSSLNLPSTLLNESEDLSNGQCNANFRSKDSISNPPVGSYQSMAHGGYARIFDDLTITPHYDLGQDPFMFPSNMQYELNQGQLETGAMLATSGTMTVFSEGHENLGTN